MSLSMENMETPLPDVLVTDTKQSEGCLRSLLVEKPLDCNEHIGFNLTRSQWDAYPWVETVDEDSAAGRSGLREGDCLLKVDGEDLVGQKISNVAKMIRCSKPVLQLLVWSRDTPANWDPESLVCGPPPSALRRLSLCLSRLLVACECPVCSRTCTPPSMQCARGHILCGDCSKAVNSCPMCRMPMHQHPLAPRIRCMVADEVYNSVVDAFELREDSTNGKLRQKVFGEMQQVKEEESDTKELSKISEVEFQAHGAKWNTQRLLQRLLPGRARSTGNISRAGRSPTRSRIIIEDRDLSRSLSTLDIARCSGAKKTSGSLSRLAGSCNSLAGSCNSLPQPTNIEEEEVDAIPSPKKLKYFCPADPECSEDLQDDVMKHVVLKHGEELLLSKNRKLTIDVEEENHVCRVLLHPSGGWFYPKCVRDHEENGFRVWCWTSLPNEASSKYQMAIEVSNNEATSLLKHSAPIFSLDSVSWSKVWSSKQALFLGDTLMEGRAKIIVNIDQIE